MIKGKEGIALIMAIFFIVALSILLTAVLMLNNQEIRATQLQLDSNKAFYYAEAGVEYAQARILKAEFEGNLDSNFLSMLSSSETDNNLKNSFNDNSIKSVDLTVVPGSSDHTYAMTCEVKYNRATRKITKEIRILYPGLWDKAMASDKDIDLSINPSENQAGRIIITGDIHSNSNINYDVSDRVTVNGNITATGEINGVPNNAPPLNIPIINLDVYKELASSNRFSSGDDFINALNNNKLDTTSKPVYVYIKADKGGWDFKLENLRQELIAYDICIIVDGDLFFNNTKSPITIGSDDYMITFIVTGKMDFTNIRNTTTFKNTLLYSQTQIDFNNLPGEVIVEGAMYSKDGYLGLSNIKNTLEITHKDWTYAQVSYLFDLYQVERWSDAGV